MLYGDAFTTIHKHPLFMTPSYRTSFRLLSHVCLLQYSTSSNVLAFRRTLSHIFARYPRISSSWTQWMKNNNRQIIANNWKGLCMAKFSLFKLPLVSFFLHVESCSWRCRGKFNLFLFYLYIFLYKSKSFMCECNGGKY